MNNPIRRSAEPLTEERLEAAERELGLRFPDRYRAFLLKHNGGVPRRTTFYHTNSRSQSVETWLDWIYPIGHEGKLDPADMELVAAYQVRPSGLPGGLLPVAAAHFAGNVGEVCIACTGENAGQVFFRPHVDPEKDTAYPVAVSWDRFLSKLEDADAKPKKWKHLVQDGDAAGLRALLEKNTKWKGKVILRGDMEEAAVEEGHWNVVELLVEKGWSASGLFTRALGSRRFDLARGLLWTGEVADETIQESLTDADELIFHLPDFVAELIEHGADVNHQDSVGQTPLHRAVEARSLEGVRFLLGHDADPTQKNDDGRTPADLAQRLEEPALLPPLREAEAARASRPAPDPLSLEVKAFDFHGVTMRDAGPALTLEEIAAFERETGLTLPPEYRGFLLASNGGTPEPDRCPIGRTSAGSEDGPDDDEDEDDDDDGGDEDEDGGYEADEGRPDPCVRFSPLLTVESPEPAEQLSPEELTRRLMAGELAEMTRSVRDLHGMLRETSSPRRMVPIGYINNHGIEGGTLLLSCKGKDRGRLYYRDDCLEMSSEGADFVIESLDALFRLLGEEKKRPPTPDELAARAIRAGDLDGLRQALAQGAQPTRIPRTGERLIDLALEKGQDDAAMLMAEAGADVNEVLPIVLQMDRPDLARRLLDGGKPVSKRALAEAMCHRALYTDPGLVRLFLERGASAKKVAMGGNWTPLHFAAQSGGVESIAVLLDAGADANAQSVTGATPLSSAAGADGDPAATVKLLLERGAKVNVPNAQGETALHQAVRAGNRESARLLIEAGEDLHARHPIFMPGMSAEHNREMARNAGQAMQQLLGMLGGRGGPDPDGPPPPDTSTPLGEMLAKAQEAMQQRMAALAGRMPQIEERMRDLAAGNVGKGRSAAQVADETPEAKAILRELEQLSERIKASKTEA